jgi:hypothetical protein
MRNLILFFLTIPAVAHANFINGNKLHEYLQSNDTTYQVYALGYITGVHDANDKVFFCSPPSVSTGQSKDVVKLYLERNPAIRDMGAKHVVSMALMEAWPCPKKQDKNKGT